MVGNGHKVGTAGAGVAKAMDPTDSYLNCSLLASMDNNLIVALGVFHPERFMDTSRATALGPGGLPVGNPRGKTWSDQNDFPDGSAGIKYTVGNWHFGASLTGGGMGTKYSTSRINPAILQIVSGSPDKYDSGMLYRLFNISPAVAYKFLGEKVAVGISPTIAYADFKTDSANGVFLQTAGRNKREHAWGLGMKAGLDWKVTDAFTFAISGHTPTWFQRFNNYRDLLIGPLSTPAQFTTGIAWEFFKNSTILLDYQFINYKGIKALGTLPAQGGFGWDDMHVFKIGLVQELTPQFTLRLGYNYGKTPIASDKSFANILAPAIDEHHFAAGLTYKLSKAHAFSIAGHYEPLKTQTDPGTGDAFSQLGRNSEIGLKIWGVQASYQWTF